LHPGSIKHGELGARIAREVGVPEEVIEMIASHTPSSISSPKSLEGVINKYADFTDADANFFMHNQKLLLDEHQ
jgi:HD superfamily phosphodiesterase